MSEPKFEYEVRLAVSLPTAWTTLLKQVAAHHYDYKCREAGNCGVINGLHNTTCDGEFPSSYAIAWRDLDLITKVMEQADYPGSDQHTTLAIRQWLRETKAAIKERHAAIVAHFEQAAREAQEAALHKSVLAWMTSMLGLRVFYVDKGHEGQRRVREGHVTKTYDSLLLASLALDDGTVLEGVRPSHVGVEHGIAGVHCGYFFPAAGEWPQP